MSILDLGTIAILFGFSVIGFVVGYLTRQFLTARNVKSAEARAAKIVTDAETRKKEIHLEAQAEALRLRKEVEEENRRRRAELQRQEERLQRRQESIERRIEPLEQRERQLDRREREFANRERELENLKQKELQELERISGLSREEAREIFLKRIEAETREDAAKVVREVVRETSEEANRLARKIIAVAMQRCASEHVSENTVASVPLPSDEMKGRIIGKQGRNIRALENTLGVDLIVDETPETVTISSFDPVRREVARLALTKLIMDGRIHPARIEQVVEKTKKEMDATIVEEGERALYELGLTGFHPELVKLVGRLRYRTSYGQQQLAHAIEVAHIASMLAAELGADVQIAKEGALLHDLGKAVSHEVEGPHALIGAELARRYGRPEKVVNAIGSHHHEEEQKYVESIIVEVADAISGARPGARRESLEQYLKRLKALEEVAHSFPGVQEAYAIQAGREIRIIVKPEEMDDLAAIRLSKEVARKVQESLEYPGQVKVTIIRETRAVEYAK